MRSLKDALSAGGLTFEDLVSAVVDSDIGVYVDHPVEGCTYGNDALCRMAGRSWEEIRGFGWAQSVHPDDVELLRAAVERYEHERGFLELRYRTLHPDGTIRILHSRVRAVVDADGAHLGTVGFVQDVTGYQAAADRAVQAQKLETIGRLASRIAHDFNNSLAAILVSASLLEPRNPGPGDNEPILIIKRAVTDAAAMTSQLLGLTRQQVGQDAVTRLDAELELLAPFLRQLLGEGMLLTVELGAPDKTVALANHQVGQIVINLAVNARDAGAKRITLETSAEGSTLELRVSDDGDGVPEAIRDQVFDPYFTTKPVGQGTGLGLATVHDLAQRAGGAVSIESAPGEGTSFRVSLPQASALLQQTSSVPKRELAGGARVLLVDDNDALRQSLAIALGLAGHHVATAESLERARARLSESAFDVVVTDVALPDGSGPELVGLLGAESGLIFMSGFSGEEVSPEMLDTPRVKYLQKPFNPRLLMLAIDEVRPTEPGC